MKNHYNLLILLAFFAYWGGVAPLDAKVCFLVGTTGQCGKEIKGHQKCEDLGYQKTAAKCMSEAKRERWVPGGGVCNGFYEKCICDETYYTLTGRESDASKYTYKDQCSIGKKLYHYRICIANYKYVTQEDSQVYSTSGMSAAKYNPVTVCGTDMQLGSVKCIDKYNSNSITRSTTCLCNTSTYPYTTVDNTSIVTLSNLCEDKPSNTKHYKTAACSGTTVNGGTWKSSCRANTEYSNSSEDKTDSKTGTRCKFCRPETCEHKYTSPQQYGSKSSCEKSSGFNANTQKCVTSGNTVGSTQCYKVVNKECSDYNTANITYYKDKSNCESGMGNDKKCISDTVQSLTCYKRVAKTCADYSGYYVSEASCKAGLTITSGQKCEKETKTANVNGLTTCYKRVKLTCASGYTLGSCPSNNECYTQAASNDSSKTGVCYKKKTCREIYYGLHTSTQKSQVTNYAKFEWTTHTKSGSDGTCYKVNGCATPASSTQPNSAVFDYTTYSTDKYNIGTQYCYQATACKTGYATNASGTSYTAGGMTCKEKKCADYGYKASRDDCTSGAIDHNVKLGNTDTKCFECKTATGIGSGSSGGSGSGSGSGATGTCKLTIVSGSCANCSCSDINVQTADGKIRFGCISNVEVPAGNVFITTDSGAYAGKHCLNSSNYNAGGNKGVSCKGTQTYYVVLCPGTY